jgi:hypothetical protein
MGGSVAFMAWTYGNSRMNDVDERRRAAEQGLCVVANVRKHSGDAELIAWAKATGRYVYVGHRTRGGYNAETDGTVAWQSFRNPLKLLVAA